MRSNIHKPGSTEPVKLTDAHYQIAEEVRPRLVQDGMFLVGLTLWATNSWRLTSSAPVAWASTQQFEQVNLNDAVIEALERKVAYMGHYHRNFANEEMAML